MYCALVLIVLVREIFEFELLGKIWCLGGDTLWFNILVKCKNRIILC